MIQHNDGEQTRLVPGQVDVWYRITDTLEEVDVVDGPC
jgi:hypothetical protein